MKILQTVFLPFLMIFAPGVVKADELPLPNGQMVSRIAYFISPDAGMLDDEGRELVWEADVTGDLNGYMKWWFETESPVEFAILSAGGIGFYEARWELWSNDGELVLAGESAGKTFLVDFADGVWDGVGVVTEAKGKYSPLKGRKIYETGPVIFNGGPPSGVGMFTIQ